jgi:hypothetical protein
VSNLSRHLRGLLIAIVALTMSAGLASAAHPATDRLSHGVQNANTTETSSETDESSETEESETESDSSDESAGDNCATDPTGLTPEELAALSHGSIVCWAAQQDTPEGWDNHGAWVSHWAKLNHGADASAAGKAKGHSHQQ